MSRLEKAIEAASRKRREQDEGPLPQPEMKPVLQPFSGAPAKDSERQENLPVTNPYLVTANDRESPAAEQYRKLKSLIVGLIQHHNLGKSLMVTSPAAGEGKSVTALNLAISMAQEFDHTVLLVEADVRKPSLLKYLGLQSQRGLTDCVLDKTDIGEVLVKTGIGRLTVLPAGRRLDNPVELFSSKHMQTLADEIRDRYSDRYVIFDTTPLLPFAEPQYIANMVDSVLLVVREGFTTPEKLKKSLEILKNNHLLGVVSNGVSRVGTMQGYYGYYGYR